MSHATRPGLPAAGHSGTIAGYRLDGNVGQGSRAVVYLAQDERLRRRVALKVMTPELARDTGFRTRMISESRAAAALGHPHIVPVFEADEADGILYAAMRYVTGGDTRSLLSRHGPLPLGYAWRIVCQVASALDAAHAHGLIHRDVRPANILLDGDDAGDRAAGGHAYLSDFGMSQVFPPGQVIAADQAAGMLDYLAPEQIEGRAADGRADQYSLACAGFEFLCGSPPFGPDQGQTLMYAQIYADPPAASARRAGIPAAVDSVLATALAKDPARRYPSCGRFAEELGAALGLRPGEPADAPRSPAPRGNGPGSPPGRLRLAGGSSGSKSSSGQARRSSRRPRKTRTASRRTGPRERARWNRPPPAIRPARSGRPRSRTVRPAYPRPRARAGGRCRSRCGRRGRIRSRLVGAIGPRPPGRSCRHVGCLLAVPDAVIAVSGFIADGARHGFRAGGGPEGSADLERRRPDDAAQRGHPGGCVHQPARRGQPAPGRGESARRAV